MTTIELKRAMASKKEIEQGLYIGHYQLNNDVTKWLNEK